MELKKEVCRIMEVKKEVCHILSYKKIVASVKEELSLTHLTFC